MPNAVVSGPAANEARCEDWWAEYTPTVQEILYQVKKGHGFKDSVHKAGSWTFHTDLTRMGCVLEKVQDTNGV